MVSPADSVVSRDPGADGESLNGEVKLPDSPRQHTLSIPSDALTLLESSIDLKSEQEGKSVGSRARRGSATMRSLLQRVMRSQSESHIRITPISQSKLSAMESRVTASACEAGDAPSTAVSPAIVNERKAVCNDGEYDDDEDDVAAKTFTDSDLVVERQSAMPDNKDEAGGLCDVFLNSSLQLLQVQSDARQRVRQLWTCAQKLRLESQLSDSGLELLHQELLSVMKALTVEKLEGARNVKSGYLTLVHAPPAVVVANMMQRGAAAATKSLLFGGARASLDQRVWVNLSEEQCRMELIPTRADERLSTLQSPVSNDTVGAASQQANGGATFPGIGKFKLPTSISWLLSDPTQQQQQKDDELGWIGRTAIKLQGCQVRRMPPTSPSSNHIVGVVEPSRVRFQILVPSSDLTIVPTPATPMTAGSLERYTSQFSYGIYVFEVPLAEGSLTADAECDEWIRAIDRVCVFHLYALENRLREATFMLQFRDVLANSFPVCVPLTWLRNRLERMPNTPAGSSMSAQQQATFQLQQQQRRSSRNLSMVQIVKDLERDRILVDKKLLITCTGGQSVEESSTEATTVRDGSVVVEHDSVAEIVKYLMGKAMAFARRIGQAKPLPHNGKPPLSATSSFSNDTLGPTSPSSRLSKFTEARALAFIERVLRGSSRTQTGGDIYDAISFFCQQRNLTICPMSHDAHPVQLNVIENEIDGLFHIEIEVSMQFKVVEMPSIASSDDIFSEVSVSPRDWAVVEGTLVRQFTLGKLSEPGTVALAFMPDLDSPDHSPSGSNPLSHEIK